MTCPPDLTVQLQPGQCGVEVFFDTLQWSSTEVLTDTVFFPPSGTFFDIGDNLVTLAVTDENGDLEVCTFHVRVFEFFATSLVCQQNVQLSLEGECNREITADELVVLDSTGCTENLEVLRLTSSGVSLPPIITASDIGATFLAVVQHTGNGMQCLTQVTISGGTPPSFTCPPNVFIVCNEPVDSSNTGTPTLSGCYQNVTLEYSDQTSSTFCPDSVAFQILRTWIGTDPFGKKDTCHQLITAFRFEIDLVDFPISFDGIFAPKLQCSDSLSLQELTDPSETGVPTFIQFPVDASPHCKVNSSYVDQVTPVCGGAYTVRRAWTVAKLCAPTATRRDTQYIHVVDTIGPQFDLPDTIFVSLDADCADSLLLPPAANVVECAGFSVEIRTPWDTLATNGGWTDVELVAGHFPVVYTLTDDCGNVSVDTSTLRIAASSLVSCPPDTVITCDFYFDTLLTALLTSNFEVLGELGMPEFPANCEFSVTELDTFSVNDCGVGTVVRTMVSNASLPQACVQEITVAHVSDFEVVFPPDVSLCQAIGNTETGEPTITKGTCEDLTLVALDDIVAGDVNGCYTLFRTWQVTNECVYTGVNEFDDTQLDSLHFADGGDGIVQFTQVIEVNASQGPVFPNGCEIPDLFLSGNSCQLTVTVPTPEVLGCGSAVLAVGGALGNQLGSNVSIGPGGYNVTYTATDACGKMRTCNTFFEVLDTVPPALQCKTLVVVDLMSTSPPMIDVFASDLALTGTDNCSNVTFSFSQDSLVNFRTYGCCEIGQNNETIWAWDEEGNVASCQSSVVVQSSSSACNECGPVFSGTCRNEETVGISQVSVNVQSLNGFNLTTLTDTAGYFEVQGSSFGDDYGITPSKNTNHKNGVTTFDGVMMTRHILGTVPLGSPYLLIAADVNNSESITTFDIVELRRLILNIYLEFPNNSSWRFVPADFEFPNPMNPWANGWPEFIQVNDVTGDVPDLDFIGIKIGDLNGSANPLE